MLCKQRTLICRSKKRNTIHNENHDEIVMFVVRKLFLYISFTFHESIDVTSNPFMLKLLTRKNYENQEF